MEKIECSCCGGNDFARYGNKMQCRFCGSIYAVSGEESPEVTDAKVLALLYTSAKKRASGDPAGEMMVLAEALSLDGNNTVILTRLGRLHREMGNFGKAEELYNRVTKLDPNSPLGYAGLGAMYVIRNENEKALPYLEKCIPLYHESDYDLAVSLANYGIALGRTGRKAEAKKALKKAKKKGYENLNAACRMAGVRVFWCV